MAGNIGNLKPFKKGQSGNPSGRPALLPEVQRAIDANRNAVKVMILSKLEGKVEAWIENIIAQGSEDGDVLKLKILLELALGKMVDDQPEFPVSDEEKLLVLEFRRRKEAQSNEHIISGEPEIT